jgi:hypothetical protein
MRPQRCVRSMSESNLAGAAKSFDYDTSAELFEVQGRISGRRSCGYRRFDRAADAIRFAVEDLPPKQLAGAYLEVDEARFDSNAIRRLYDSAEFPLARRAVGQP